MLSSVVIVRALAPRESVSFVAFSTFEARRFSVLMAMTCTPFSTSANVPCLSSPAGRAEQLIYDISLSLSDASQAVI